MTEESPESSTPQATAGKSSADAGWIASIIMMTILLGAFVVMRLLSPSQYGERDWPALHTSKDGQAIVLTLHSERFPNAKRKGGMVRDVDGMRCKVTVKPDGGDFSTSFVEFMNTEIPRLSSDKQPAVVFRNHQGTILYSPVPITFSPVKEGDKVSEYTGEGQVVLRPHEGSPDVWDLDWVREHNF